MKLYRLNEVVYDGSGRIFRQSRAMATVSAVVLGGAFGGAPFLWYFVGAPWPVCGLCGLLALFVVPVVCSDLRTKCCATNWLLWIRNDGVWINFRSYQDRGSTDVPIVAALGFAEISEARQLVERYTTPKNRGSTLWTLKSLELTLSHDDTEALAAAMDAARHRPQPERSYFGVRVTSHPTHYAVSLPTPNRLRLAWSGGVGNCVTPSLNVVIRELGFNVLIGDAVHRDRESWRHLADAEFDDQVLQLAQQGDTINAVRLLTIRKGYTTTEAKQVIDELTAAK